MSVIEEIQERLDKEYVGYDRDDIMEDVSSVLILFAAKDRAIQIKIDKLKDYANWSEDYDKAEFAIEQLKELL